MKKRIIAIMMMFAILGTSLPVHATEEKEILFREVAWGVNYEDACNIVSDIDWYDMHGEYMKKYPVGDILYGYGEGIDIENSDINVIASPWNNNNISVAGYTTESISMYFAFVPNDGVLTKDLSDTALYGAEYEFLTQKPIEMFDDLVAKMCSLYGDDYETKERTNHLDTKITTAVWRGKENTAVSVRLEDDSEDYEYAEDRIYIGYAWENGDELLQQASDTIDQMNISAEEGAYGNNDVSGL